jgi:hypothetical protein
MAKGQAIDLENATKDRVDCTDQPEFDFTSGDFTWECWLKPESFGAADGIICNIDAATGGHTFQYKNNTNGEIIHYFIDGAAAWKSVSSGSNTLNLGLWNHVATVFDDTANTFTIYFDGVQKGQSVGITTNPAAPSTARNLEIGRYNYNDAYCYDGAIQNVRLSDIKRYTTNFTPDTELQAADANTIGLWWFDDDMTDQSSNGNDGSFETTGGSEAYIEGTLDRPISFISQVYGDEGFVG